MNRPLRLGIDAHRLVSEPQTTSGSIYLSAFLKGICAFDLRDSLEVSLYLPGALGPLNPCARLVEHAGFVLRQPAKNFNHAMSYRNELRWIQLTVPRLAAHDSLDVFFCPFHLTPLFLGGVPIVTTIHDVCPLSHPQCFSPMGRLIHKAQFWSAVTRASRLVAVSEYTAASLARFYPAAASKTRVVRIGLDAVCSNGSAPALVGPANSYFVWIGSAEGRKNAPLVFQAYRKYLEQSQSQTTDSLVIVVPKSQALFFRGLASEYELGTQVAILSDISEESKRAVLRDSIALLFPSQCEGFGLPILEAMQQGCIPLVYSDGPGPELTSNCVPALSELTPSRLYELMVWAKHLQADARTRTGRTLQTLAQKLNSTAMARELVRVFEEVASKPQVSRSATQFDKKVV